MDVRQQQLTQLKEYTVNVDKEVTFLLQNLQWDPKLTTEKHPMVACCHDSNHRVPSPNKDAHEKQCYLNKLGYRKEDTFLPDPVDPDAHTLVKLSKHEIAEIIKNAAIDCPLFKRADNVIDSMTEGIGSQGPEPLTAERLLSVYSADERRAIHDAVVNAAPFCHDLADLDLLSSKDDAVSSDKKSRLQILAELRNMKRRRTKYRVAAKTRNYSNILRDVIKSQMDSYGEATKTIIKTEYGTNMYVSQKYSNNSLENISTHCVVKLERESPEPQSYNRYTSDNPKERHRAKSREKRYTNDRRAFHKGSGISTKDRSYNYICDQSVQSREESSKISRRRFEKRDEREREKRYDGEERKRYKDSSTEKSYKYDDRRQNKSTGDYNRSRSKRHDEDRNRYHKDYSTQQRSKTKHDIVIKEERASQESDLFTNYTRDEYRESHRDRSRSKDRRHHDHTKDHKKKYSYKERSDYYSARTKDTQDKYSYDKVINIKQERSPENDYINNEETSRKRRERSKSKETKADYKKHKKDEDSFRKKTYENREKR